MILGREGSARKKVKGGQVNPNSCQFPKTGRDSIREGEGERQWALGAKAGFAALDTGARCQRDGARTQGKSALMSEAFEAAMTSIWPGARPLPKPDEQGWGAQVLVITKYRCVMDG